MWARNGRELFYLDGSRTLTAVPVQTSGPTFRAGTPAKVFDAGGYTRGYARDYDVSPDGQRFLMIKDGPKRDELIVVERWFEELKPLSPSTAGRLPRRLGYLHVVGSPWRPWCRSDAVWTSRPSP